jgi:hypothetical protein
VHNSLGMTRFAEVAHCAERPARRRCSLSGAGRGPYAIRALPDLCPGTSGAFFVPSSAFRAALSTERSASLRHSVVTASNGEMPTGAEIASH